MEINDREKHELKKWMQGLFTDRLVTIVGSGLSCAEGLPGMKALAEKLKEKIPDYINDMDEKIWENISDCLESDGLEGALLKHKPTETIESAIVKVTAEYILSEEQIVIEKCIIDGKKLKLSYLLPHISPSSLKVARIITTNYDRLIEFAAEYENWGVDSMVIGRYWGKHDPASSKGSLIKHIRKNNKNSRVIYQDHIELFKPHGSLDWFMNGDNPIMSCIGNLKDPLIITPGVGKYKKGYNEPFDTHREKGNKAIDDSSAILCIGYGFNDEHLQTHLMRKIKSGTKTLILVRELTKNTAEIIEEAPECKALIFNESPSGTMMVAKQEKRLLIPNVQWWDIEFFTKEVLEQ